MQPLFDFFRRYPALFKPGAKVLIACSGGPDSVALAWGIKEIQNQYSLKVELAHINHQLRGSSSEADEKFVRRLAKELGWRCHVLKRPVRPLKSGNLEEVARNKRYEALVSIAQMQHTSVIFTAHTLDDQVETVLMNLMRGAGPDGLAGMAPARLLENSHVLLVRPLLSVSKKELLDWLEGFNGQFRQDKSNQNPKFLRNWLRAELVPFIEKKSPDFKKKIKNLAEMALDEKRFWDQEIFELEGKLLKRYRGGRLLDLGGLLRYSPAVQRRFLRRSLGQDLLTFEAVERLREWMQSPPKGGRLWQLKQGWVVERLSKSKGSPSTRLFWFKHSKIGKG